MKLRDQVLVVVCFMLASCVAPAPSPAPPPPSLSELLERPAERALHEALRSTTMGNTPALKRRPIARCRPV